MPQTCSVCRSKLLHEIDTELVSGNPLRNIAKRNGLSATALFRHKRDHLPQKLILTKQHQDALSAENLLDEMAHLKAHLRSGLDQAEAAGNPQAFLGFSREYRATLETYFAISERIAEKAQGPMSLTPGSYGTKATSRDRQDESRRTG